MAGPSGWAIKYFLRAPRQIHRKLRSLERRAQNGPFARTSPGSYHSERCGGDDQALLSRDYCCTPFLSLQTYFSAFLLSLSSLSLSFPTSTTRAPPGCGPKTLMMEHLRPSPSAPHKPRGELSSTTTRLARRTCLPNGCCHACPQKKRKLP